jgi:hypothetical protein
MPVQYQPYKSMFVSQHSPEIAEILKERYTRNFAMQDEVAQHLAQLQTAPFEGDKAEAANLQKDIYGQIEQFSSRGDYENLTMDVSKLASNYQSRATPLIQNQKLYEADREAKQKEVAAGRITQGDYEGWEALSRLQYDPTVGDYVDYTGVKFDENNRPVAGSYYTPKSLAQYVDVQGEILEQLNSLKEVKEGGYTIRGYQTIDGIEYAMTRENQIKEYVPQELVRQVTENVLRRPDVQAYMEQQSKFATIKADEPTLNAQLTNYARTLRGSESSEARTRAAEIENLVANGTSGAKRKALQDALYSSDYNRYFSMGMNARRPSAYGGGKSMEYSQAYLAGVKGNKTEIASDDVILTQGQTQQIVSPLAEGAAEGATTATIATTTEKARANMKVAGDALVARSEKLQGMTGDVVASSLGSLSLPGAKRWGSIYGIDPTTIENAWKAIQTQKGIIEMGERAIQFSREAAGATPEQILQKAEESGQFNVNALRTALTTQEQRLAFAIDLASKVRTVVVPMLPAGQTGSTLTMGTDTFQTPVTSAGADASNRNRDAIKLVETTLQRVFGMNPQEARRMAAEAATQTKNSSGIFSQTFGEASVYDDAIEALADITLSSEREAAEQLKLGTLGSIRLPELTALEGDSKKVQTELEAIFKRKNGTDLRGLATSSGQSVETILGGPEVAGNYNVSDISMVKGVRADGGVEYMFGVQFKGGDGDPVPPRVVVPFEQMVAYMPPAAEQTLRDNMNTSADFILDQVYTKAIHAPGVAQAKGVEIRHNTDGYNLTFNFTPTFGNNNSIAFGAIEMSGTTPNGRVDYVFSNEQEFYNMYNDFTTRISGQQ